MVGAGSAGIGVAQALHSAMVEAGTPGGYKAAASNFMVFDKDGLVGRGRRGLTEEVMVYARDDLPDGMGIAAAIEQEIWGRCRGDMEEIEQERPRLILYPYAPTPTPNPLPLSPHRCPLPRSGRSSSSASRAGAAPSPR